MLPVRVLEDVVEELLALELDETLPVSILRLLVRFLGSYFALACCMMFGVELGMCTWGLGKLPVERHNTDSHNGFSVLSDCHPT